MTLAPAACAICNANIETPPVPNSSTVCPVLRFPDSNKASQVLTAAHGTVAASAKVIESGIATSDDSGQVRTDAVAAGEIATPMNDMEAGDFDDTNRPAIPARRTGHPDEVASVIRFLASDETGFVTGVRWPVDGGFEAATPLAASAYLTAKPT